MRFITFVLLLQNFLFSQDSLFWFDMSKVRDSIPTTPMVIDKIFGTSQLKMIDSLRGIQVSTKEGYRLQLFESSTVDEAKKVMNKYLIAISGIYYNETIDEASMVIKSSLTRVYQNIIFENIKSVLNEVVIY